MNRRRGYLEEPLDVRLRRRTSVHQRIGVNEREILALPGRETGRESPFARFIVALDSGGSAMNIRYRVELSEAERGQLAALVSGGKHAARKIKRAQILLAADAGVGDEAIAASVSGGGAPGYRTKRRF